MAAPSPENREENLVTFRVMIDDEELESDFVIESIQIIRDINRVPLAEIRLSDGGVADEERFEAGNSDKLIPGKKITIMAGYHSDDQPIFKGIVISPENKNEGFLRKTPHPL